MLLAVDTSTAQIGIAMYSQARVNAELLWHSRQHHTVELAPALAELLKRTGLTMDDIKALAVAIGPGSFTALRVGLAFIKGLALARDLPVMGIPTLDILAPAQPISKLPLGAVLEAGRGRIALGWYKYDQQGWKAEGVAQVTTVDALIASIHKPTLVAGELTDEERQRLTSNVNVTLSPPSLCVRRPSILAELAFRRWQAGLVDELASLAPIYLQIAEPIKA